MNARARRAKKLMERPRFRAAYDFLALRAQAGEPLDERVEYWTSLQEGKPVETQRRDQKNDDGPSRPRRRRRRRRPSGDASSGDATRNSAGESA